MHSPQVVGSRAVQRATQVQACRSAPSISTVPSFPFLFFPSQAPSFSCCILIVPSFLSLSHHRSFPLLFFPSMALSVSRSFLLGLLEHWKSPFSTPYNSIKLTSALIVLSVGCNRKNHSQSSSSSSSCTDKFRLYISRYLALSLEVYLHSGSNKQQCVLFNILLAAAGIRVSWTILAGAKRRASLKSSPLAEFTCSIIKVAYGMTLRYAGWREIGSRLD